MTVYTCESCGADGCTLDLGSAVSKPDFCPLTKDICKWKTLPPKHKDMEFIKDKLSECLQRLE